MGERRDRGTERVTAFRFGEVYLFKHYFESEVVFERLRRYYDTQQYRFEVPAPDFERVQSFLAGHGYELVEADAVEPFVVVVRQYTEHPEDVFEQSVRHRSANGYNYFLLTGETAVRSAVGEGATRLADADVENVFATD